MTIELNLTDTLTLNCLTEHDYKYKISGKYCACCRRQIYGYYENPLDEYYQLCENCKGDLENTFKAFLETFNRYELHYLDDLVEGTTLVDLAGRRECEEATQ